MSTHDVFKGQFEFPEVAKNDFSTEVLDELEIAEKNLNSNMDNVDLYNNFVETAEACRKKLKNKYADQWTDPGIATAEKKGSKEDDDEWVWTFLKYLRKAMISNLLKRWNG